MNIIFLLVFLAIAGAAFWYYSKNKEKVKDWFSSFTKKKTETSNTSGTGDIYVANVSEDCTGLKENPLNDGTTLEIHVKSTDQVSLHGLVKGKGNLQSMTQPSNNNSSSSIQTGVFINSGCIKYTTDGDVIKLTKDDNLKWIGKENKISQWVGEEDVDSIVFRRSGEDTIVGTNTKDGSVCKFKKSATKKASKECEKPSVGCSMM